MSEFVPNIPTVLFDGRSFYVEGEAIPFFYLARKARMGDREAAEVLTAFQVTIRDASGTPYWPPTEENGKR